MIRKGWKNEGWRHSLAAKGIKTNSPYMKHKVYHKGKLKATAKFLLDDGSNPGKNVERPDFATEDRLDYANSVRADAKQELEAAQQRGEITYDQAETFWKQDFKQEFDDFLDKRFTAEQFKKQVERKIQRVTTSVPIIGVSDEDQGSLLPQKEDSF